MTLEKHKFKIDLVRSIVVSACTVGVLYGLLIGRIQAIETKDAPSRIEFDNFIKISGMELKNVPSKYEVNALQNSLDTITKQLETALPKINQLEKDVAVIAEKIK